MKKGDFPKRELHDKNEECEASLIFYWISVDVLKFTVSVWNSRLRSPDKTHDHHSKPQENQPLLPSTTCFWTMFPVTEQVFWHELIRHWKQEVFLLSEMKKHRELSFAAELLSPKKIVLTLPVIPNPFTWSIYASVHVINNNAFTGTVGRHFCKSIKREGFPVPPPACPQGPPAPRATWLWFGFGFEREEAQSPGVWGAV